jgi:glycosyltransferase involved in cell wall biosynthesis
MKMSETPPKVSVCVVTYNQEKYIRQCLQSIVDQETDFDFEVIVSDDCSTDGTRNIVTEFAEKYPLIIKPIYHSKNIGAYKNFFFAHNAAIGNYIAHVDGDDYCFQGKLKKQSDILDSDPNCNIVFHRMMLLKPSGQLIEGGLLYEYNIENMRFNRGSILQFIAIGSHSSKMYRKPLNEYVVPNFDITDYFTNVEQVGDGYARFVGHQNLGVYRVGIGISSQGISTRVALAESFKYFHKKYPEFHLQINTAALTYFIADLKNFRKSWWIFCLIWIETFHPLSLVNLLRNIRFMKKL